MSFTFKVRASAPSLLRFADLQRAVGHPIEFVEPLQPDDLVRGVLQVYRRGVTTRAIEVEADEAHLSVRILTCSSPEDYELALSVVVAAANHMTAAEVEPEDADPIPVARVRDVYDADWAADEIAFGAAAIARTVDANPGKLITLQGPIRPFVVGGRLLEELRQGPPDGLASRLIEAMRRTQWPGDCFAASVIGITAGPSERQIRLAVLTGRSRILLPYVEAIALQGPDGGQVYVPPADVAELLPEHARYLDEGHLLVEPVHELRWAELLRAAESRAIDIDDL